MRRDPFIYSMLFKTKIHPTYCSWRYHCSLSFDIIVLLIWSGKRAWLCK